MIKKDTLYLAPGSNCMSRICRPLLSVVLLAVGVGGGGVLAQQPTPGPSSERPLVTLPDTTGEPVSASDTSELVSDTTVGVWVYDALARFNASQAAYRNWEEGGGTSSLAFTARLEGEAARRGERWVQAYELRLGFGILNQEGQDLRKSEDRFRWTSTMFYEGDGFFKRFPPTFATNLRTQFAAGFDHTGNPFQDHVPEGDPRFAAEPPVQTSAFFSPAFITESLGLSYDPSPGFSVRLGGALKQTVVLEEDLRVLYDVEPDRRLRNEAGAEFVATLDQSVSENIQYQSRLRVFMGFTEFESPPDALWENTIHLKVNDWLSTDLELVALFDRNISEAIQLKETISVGFSFDLL